MPLLNVTDVTHSFGGLCALSGFNLSLNPSELVGIIGPNGAGKTTLFNLITGIYRPDKGSIAFGGSELTGRRPYKITSMGIARTFQNIRLFNELTVLDNIRIAHYTGSRYSPVEALLHAGRYRAEERRIIDRSLELLAFFEMDHLSVETAGNLSYGLQRRLEIVRALATKPQLLLLDEPAAGMNTKEIDRLMEFIRWIHSEFKLTILLIEHQMRLVMNICERLVVLDFGVTIAEGTPRQIQDNQQVLESYLGPKNLELGGGLQ
ncbi:MAG: ABC transporter ATP-binding protein [Nitrospirae bacterium]|nr:ABC transporter ATP-binding protein [Nitrospirota bacterium]